MVPSIPLICFSHQAMEYNLVLLTFCAILFTRKVDIGYSVNYYKHYGALFPQTFALLVAFLPTLLAAYD